MIRLERPAAPEVLRATGKQLGMWNATQQVVKAYFERLFGG